MARDYAKDRFKEHVARFETIADMIESGNIDDNVKEILKSEALNLANQYK